MLPAEKVVNDLRTFDAHGTPALTLYLATDPSRDTSPSAQFAELLRPLKERLGEGPAGEQQRRLLSADVEVVKEFLGGLDAAPRGLAIFSCAELGFFRALPAAVRFRPGVSWGEHFDLRPLLAAVAEQDRVLVLLIDKEKARFFRVALDEIEEFEDLWDYVPRKQRQGDFGAQPHMQRDHEMHVLAHVRHAVDALARIDAGEPARRVLVGGPEEVLAAFTRFLPKHLRPRVHPTLRVPVSATPTRVLEIVREVNRTLERESEERLVAELLSEGRRHAALGPQSVAEAVNEKRAQLLLITEGLQLGGSECPRCHAIYAENGRDFCALCGSELRRVPDLVPALEEAVLRQDGRIQEVRGGAARSLVAHGGVAARVRYLRPTIMTA